MRGEEFTLVTNRDLIDELNEFCVALKIHLHGVNTTEEHLQLLKGKHPIPSIEQIDQIQSKINHVLFKEKTSARKF